LFVEQRCDGLRAAVAAGEAGSTTADHHLHGRIGNPAADRGTDGIAVIGSRARSPAGDRRLSAIAQQIAGGIRRCGVGAAPIGNGEQGNRQAHRRLESKHQRTVGSGFSVVRT